MTTENFINEISKVSKEAGEYLKTIELNTANIEKERTAQDALLEAFRWGDTKQGLDFWGEIFDKLGVQDEG